MGLTAMTTPSNTEGANSDAPADVVRSAVPGLGGRRSGGPSRHPLPRRGVDRDGPSFPLAGTYRTPEGVTSGVMERLALEWDEWIAHDDTYVADGENVVVLARYTAANKATGKRLAVRVAHHFVVRGGRIVRFEQFVDTALVRDAMTN